MMDRKQLREADFITSILLILFSIWELSQAFSMPMKDSYAGVSNVWYVSPALLPIFIGASLLILGCVLCRHSIRNGGLRTLVQRWRRSDGVSTGLSEAGESFLSILLAFGSFVYLTIPRIDFFLAILNFLFYFMVIFYFDDRAFKRMYGLWYAAAVALFTLISAIGLYRFLHARFFYLFDILFLLLFAMQLVVVRGWARRHDRADRFRVAWIVTLLTPTVLVPLFRYFLLVQLPYEGGIIRLMNLVYYALR